MAEIVIINEVFRQRRGALRKNGTRGRDRVSIEVETQPILHAFDDRVIGKGVAEAIAAEIKRGIKAVTATAKPATIKWRQKARAAAQNRPKKGGKPREPWAKQRFAGGRTGATPPKAGATRMFNNSGRFADTIVVRLNRTDKSFTTNVAANRLDRRDFNDLEFRRFLAALRKHVPALDPKRLANVPAIKEALNDSINDLIIVAKDELDAKRKALRAQQRAAAIALGKAVIGAV